MRVQYLEARAFQEPAWERRRLAGELGGLNGSEQAGEEPALPSSVHALKRQPYFVEAQYEIPTPFRQPLLPGSLLVGSKCLRPVAWPFTQPAVTP